MEHLPLAAVAPAECPLVTDIWDGAPVDLDVVNALREIMGEVFTEAVAAFVEDTSTRLAAMQASLSRSDSQGLWQIAHAMKGTSSNVGAVGLAAMAECIEKFCKTGQIEKVSSYLGPFANLYVRTCDILKALEGEPEATSNDAECSPAQSLALLCVDDARLLRLMIRSFFAQARPQWSFAEASDAQEALTYLTQQRVDVMTVDMHMPGCDGLTLAQQVRRLSPATYIVLVTADIRDEVQQRAAELGIALLQKPITEAAIAALLPTLEQHHAALLTS